MKNKSKKKSVKKPFATGFNPPMKKYNVIKEQIICLNCFNCDKSINVLEEGIKNAENYIEWKRKASGNEHLVPILINFQNSDGSVRLIDIDSTMWDDAIVEKMAAGYGSSHDGDMFLVGICDECMKNKMNSGNTILVGNYMASDVTIEAKKSIENSIQKARRLKNINELTKDGK